MVQYIVEFFLLTLPCQPANPACQPCQGPPPFFSCCANPVIQAPARSGSSGRFPGADPMQVSGLFNWGLFGAIFIYRSAAYEVTLWNASIHCTVSMRQTGHKCQPNTGRQPAIVTTMPRRDARSKPIKSVTTSTYNVRLIQYALQYTSLPGQLCTYGDTLCQHTARRVVRRTCQDGQREVFKRLLSWIEP